MIRSVVQCAIHLRSGREMLLIGVAYMLYEVVRSLSSDRSLDAFQNAEVLVRAERALGIFAELNVQVAVLSWEGFVDFLSLWYFWGHFPLIIAFAVWAFARHRPDYLWARNAIFASGAIALVIYLAFPVAPPRLFPGAGFVDTLRDVFALQYEDSSLVNQFAAVPSMHQGFAIIVGVTLYRMVGGRRGMAVMVALPTLMFISIVATGNHWFLDALFGAIVAAVGMAVASRIEQHGLPGAARRLLSAEAPGGESGVSRVGGIVRLAESWPALSRAPVRRGELHRSAVRDGETGTKRRGR